MWMRLISYSGSKGLASVPWLVLGHFGVCTVDHARVLAPCVEAVFAEILVAQLVQPTKYLQSKGEVFHHQYRLTQVFGD